MGWNAAVAVGSTFGATVFFSVGVDVGSISSTLTVAVGSELEVG